MKPRPHFPGLEGDMIRDFLARRYRRRLAAKHRAALARQGMAAHVNINPHLIALHMRESQWKQSRRHP